MYFMKRAFLYLKKQKAKTILLLVLFFLIANIVLAGLSIQSTSEAAVILTRQELGADILYTANTSKINLDYKNNILDATVDKSTLEGIPLVSNVDALTESAYVESVDLIITYEVTTDLVPYDTRTTAPSTSTSGSKIILGNVVSTGDVSFETFSRVEPFDFTSESSVLLEGRYATQDEIDGGLPVAIIETHFAAQNDLSVGDVMMMTPTLEGSSGQVYAYTIIGIYENKEILDDKTLSTLGTSFLPENRIYTPFNTLKTIGLDDATIESLVLDKAIITLDDPIHIDAYMADVEGLVPMTYGILSANDTVYESLAGPIETLGSLSAILVWIVVIAGASILSLITALTISQRKNEIGILLAIGESKVRIVGQFIVETVAIALLAFTLSTFTGMQIGKVISQTTLETFLVTEEPTVTQTGSGKNKTTTVDPTTISPVELNFQFEPLVMIEFYTAGILISIVSVLIPALYVTRFNPKKILTNNG